MKPFPFSFISLPKIQKMLVYSITEKGLWYKMRKVNAIYLEKMVGNFTFVSLGE